eukprot:2382412-Rhodomonas_salina.2
MLAHPTHREERNATGGQSRAHAHAQEEATRSRGRTGSGRGGEEEEGPLSAEDLGAIRGGNKALEVDLSVDKLSLAPHTAPSLSPSTPREGRLDWDCYGPSTRIEQDREQLTWPAIGVLQEPSSVARKERCKETREEMSRPSIALKGEVRAWRNEERGYLAVDADLGVLVVQSADVLDRLLVIRADLGTRRNQPEQQREEQTRDKETKKTDTIEDRGVCGEEEENEGGKRKTTVIACQHTATREPPGKTRGQELGVEGDLDTDGTLCNGGKHLIPVQDLGHAIGHVHALQTRKREESSINDIVVELAETRLNVAAEVHALDARVLGQELSLTPERGGANDGALGQLLDSLVLRGDERVTGVLAREHGFQVRVIREEGGHILHGVHAEVNLISKQRDIQFLREQPLSADL